MEGGRLTPPPTRENLEIGEWIHILDQSPLTLAETLQTEFAKLVEAEGYVLEAKVSSPKLKSFQTLFRSGLKNPDVLTQIGDLRFRFVDVREDSRRDTSEPLLRAIAYEMEIYLVPRYRVSGNAGNYSLEYAIEARSLSEKVKQSYRESGRREPHSLKTVWDGDHVSYIEPYSQFVRTHSDDIIEKFVHISTRCQSLAQKSTRQIAMRKGMSERTISAISAVNAVREGLRQRIMSGGLPGLGKSR